MENHGWLARWRKWKSCDVGEAKEGLENELWRRRSNGSVGEWAVTLVKRRKGWRMSCDVGEVTESLENEQSSFYFLFYIQQSSFYFILFYIQQSSYFHSTYSRAHSPSFPSLHLRHSWFSNPSVALPTPQLIHQPFRCFTYVTAHSPTLLLLLLRHRIFTYVTWRAAHAKNWKTAFLHCLLPLITC